MRRIEPHELWIGDRGDVRDLAHLRRVGIRALIDLALDEPPVSPGRETVYCRFPLIDGVGNAAWLIHSAIGATAALLRTRTPTLVFCSGGMSRSPAIAAAAVALVTQAPAHECLMRIVESGPADVSPGLWQQISGSLSSHLPGTPQ